MSNTTDTKQKNSTPYSCYRGARRMELEEFSEHMARWESEFVPEIEREAKVVHPTPSTWTTVYVHNDSRNLHTREDYENSHGFDPNDYEYLQSLYE